MKKLAVVFLLLLVGGILAYGAVVQQKFDKKAFYAAMASGSMDEVNADVQRQTEAKNVCAEAGGKC